MMLKERKGEVRRRRGGTVPGERDGGRGRERQREGGSRGRGWRISVESGLPGCQHAAQLHPGKSQNVMTVLELAFFSPLLIILLNLPLSSFPICVYGGCEDGLVV